MGPRARVLVADEGESYGFGSVEGFIRMRGNARREEERMIYESSRRSHCRLSLSLNFSRVILSSYYAL